MLDNDGIMGHQSMKNAAPIFRIPELSDADAVRRCTLSALQSDLSFTNLYLLREKYHTEIMFHVEHLLRYFGGETRLKGYAFPAGKGDMDAINSCLHVIETDAERRGKELRFCLLTEEEVAKLKTRYGNKMTVSCDEGDSDYIYNTAALANLPGTLYHKKRNHIRKFERMYGKCIYMELTAENSDKALGIAAAWKENMDNSPAPDHEFAAIKKALSMPELLQLRGGILLLNNRPIAMCVASVINENMTDIHYEKCIPEFRDAYPIINREFALRTHTPLINREEDLNIEGLRRAKLSYYPSLILKKFNAHITC